MVLKVGRSKGKGKGKGEGEEGKGDLLSDGNGKVAGKVEMEDGEVILNPNRSGREGLSLAKQGEKDFWVVVETTGERLMKDAGLSRGGLWFRLCCSRFGFTNKT